MIRLGVLLACLAGPVAAEAVVAARTIPARSIIDVGDIVMRDLDVAGGIQDPALVVGLESRVALYAGRPIRSGDVGPPAVVDRNQIITLVFDRGGITISTEGRALDRAGPGDVIRVMNLSSRTTVTARLDASGTAFVTQ